MSKLKSFVKGNVISVNGEAYIVISNERTLGSGNVGYDILSCNHSNASSYIENKPTTKQLRKDLTLEERELVSEARTSACVELPDSFYEDVPNPYHINNVKLLGSSVLDYVRKSFCNVFSGLWVDKSW